MKTFHIVTLVCLFSFHSLYAQDSTQVQQKPKLDWGLVGNLYVSSDLNNMFIGFGGPKIGMRIKNDWAISVGFYPSLRIPFAEKPKIGLNLGVGPQVSYKSWSILAPIYFLNGDPVYTLGLGYNIQRIKKSKK
jgi:hypothetical protein